MHSRSVGSIIRAGFLCLSVCLASTLLLAQEHDDVRGAPAEPADATDIRAQMAIAESLSGRIPDRGAILYFLAVSHALLRETLAAIQQLQQCVALKEGFDPSGDSVFAVLRNSSDFTKLVEQVRKDFPAVNQSRILFTSVDKDIFPEGLAYDQANDSLYLSSLYHPRILKIPHDGKAEDFVPSSRYNLLPVLGIRMDPSDGTIWSCSADEDTGKSELLHFDRAGVLLDRHPPTETGQHVFNDLVVLRSGAIYLTDTSANKVYRFDPQSKAFSAIALSRPLLLPNGIAVTNDESYLYIADQLGIVGFDLKSWNSVDVDPGLHNTVAGVDGLYWHKGSLIAVQNGIGTPRVVAFRLAPDGLHVTRTTVLANQLSTPTTGAIRHEEFYFILNSQPGNLNGQRILDVTKLQPVRIATVHLP